MSLDSGQPPPGGVLPYITYVGMCRCEGYGFQTVWSGVGYRNQGVLVENRVSITGKLICGVKILVQNGFDKLRHKI